MRQCQWKQLAAVYGEKCAAPGGPAGGGADVAPTLRSNFADTAYWVASSTADENGIVEVKFTVPDNLTTWKIKAWTMGDGTRVGSGTSDIISSKDLIIRPQTPRFFTERDQIVLSAVVHNYLASEKSVKVVIENEGGHLKLLDEADSIRHHRRPTAKLVSTGRSMSSPPA